MARSLNLQSIRRERHKSLIACEMCFPSSFKDEKGEQIRMLSWFFSEHQEKLIFDVCAFVRHSVIAWVVSFYEKLPKDATNFL